MITVMKHFEQPTAVYQGAKAGGVMREPGDAGCLLRLCRRSGSPWGGFPPIPPQRWQGRGEARGSSRR